MVAEFGEVAAGQRPTRTIRLYDNTLPDVTVARVTSLSPARFTATLVAPPAGEAAHPDPSVGRHIGDVQITAHAEAGSLNGQVEIVLAGQGHTPDRVDVIGEVVGPVTCRPSQLVLPRSVGGRPVYEAAVVVSAQGGKPVRVTADAAPPGLIVTAGPAGGEVAVRVRAEAGSAGGTVRLRVRPDGGEEVIVAVPVTVVQGE